MSLDGEEKKLSARARVCWRKTKIVSCSTEQVFGKVNG